MEQGGEPVRMVFGTHAVRGVVKRKLDPGALCWIAAHGVEVETRGIRHKIRGQYNDRIIDVVVEEPNVIVTAFPRKTARITKP